jgi:hypothetical protein
MTRKQAKVRVLLPSLQKDTAASPFRSTGKMLDMREHSATLHGCSDTRWLLLAIRYPAIGPAWRDGVARRAIWQRSSGRFRSAVHRWSGRPRRRGQIGMLASLRPPRVLVHLSRSSFLHSGASMCVWHHSATAQEDGCSSLPCRAVLSFRSGAREASLLGGAAAAWPLAAPAQQGERMWRLAIIMLTADDADGQARITALREGLEKLGWTAHNGTWQCAPRRNSAVHRH